MFYLVAAFILSFSVVQMASVKGRWHILKISVNIAGENFLSSGGPFSYRYNHSQIDYFKRNGIVSEEAYHADEVNYALNDIVHTTILHGWRGFLALLILCIFFCSCLRRNRYTKVYSFVLLLAPFYIFLMTSFPLQVPFLCLLFILFHLPLLNQLLRNNFKGRFYKTGTVVTVTLAALTIFFFIIKQNEWAGKNAMLEKYRSLWDNGFHKEALAGLAARKNDLQCNKKYIYYTGLYLHLAGENKQALEFLKGLHENGCGYDYHMLLGEIYQEEGLNAQAVTEYNYGLYLVPVKLESRYRLMKFYTATHQKDSALYFAQNILKTPVKIKNPASDRYRLAAIQLLHPGHTGGY